MILELTDTVATDTRSAQDEACQTPMMNGGGSHEASQLPGGGAIGCYLSLRKKELFTSVR